METELTKLRQAYLRGENITQLLRGGSTQNEQRAVLLAYDMQSGSYVSALEDQEYDRQLREYAVTVAQELQDLKPSSLMEAGVGEATTLALVVQAMDPVPITALDLSWSRIQVASEHLAKSGIDVERLFVGELESIALPSNSIDVIYTSHAIEPNFGREEVILRELLRVAQRYVVLFEPAYEFASKSAQERMESLGYCRGLADTARKLGARVVKHELTRFSLNPKNPTGVLVLEKPSTVSVPPVYSCPSCQSPLLPEDGHWFCSREGLVYPTLKGIPCLTRSHAIVASLFRKE